MSVQARSSRWQAVKRILWYLKHTVKYGILFHGSSDSQLHAFFDVDWAVCPDDRRSTGGYAIFLGPNIISWSPWKQHMVGHSYTDVEYRALTNATLERLWVQSLL